MVIENNSIQNENEPEVGEPEEVKVIVQKKKQSTAPTTTAKSRRTYESHINSTIGHMRKVVREELESYKQRKAEAKQREKEEAERKAKEEEERRLFEEFKKSREQRSISETTEAPQSKPKKRQNRKINREPVKKDLRAQGAEDLEDQTLPVKKVVKKNTRRAGVKEVQPSMVVPQQYVNDDIW